MASPVAGHSPPPFFRRGPAPLVRLIAAVGLVRNAARDVPDAAVATLIAAVHDPDSVPGYDDLPCGERDLPGDIGYVLRSLPRALGQRAVPALCAALARAEDFGTMGVVEALLAFTFGEPDPGASDDGPTDADPDADPDSEDMSEQSAPPTLDPARLTPEQRQALTAMATSHELWTIGNLFFVLRSYGIPTQRAELAALLGLPVVRDEAAELAAQARFHRVHMHNPGEAAALLRRAAELAPHDPGVWQQLAASLHASDDNLEALAAVDRALALDPDHAPAHFTRGLVIVHTDPGAAANALYRALEADPQSAASAWALDALARRHAGDPAWPTTAWRERASEAILGMAADPLLRAEAALRLANSRAAQQDGPDGELSDASEAAAVESLCRALDERRSIEGTHGDPSVVLAAARLADRLGRIAHAMLVLELALARGALILVDRHGARAYHGAGEAAGQHRLHGAVAQADGRGALRHRGGLAGPDPGGPAALRDPRCVGHGGVD